MRTICLIAASVCLGGLNALVGGDVVFAAEDYVAAALEKLPEEDRKTLEEFLAATEDLERLAGNLTMEVTQEMVIAIEGGDAPGETERISRRFVFRANDPLMRLDIFPVATGRTDRNELPTVFLAGQDQSIHAGPLEAGQDPVVVNWDADFQHASNTIEGLDFPGLVGGRWGVGLQDILSSGFYGPTVRITGVSEERDAETGERLVTISVVTKIPELTLAGRFVFRADHSWVLKSYTWGSEAFSKAGDVEITSHALYEGSKDGIPLLKGLTQVRREFSTDGSTTVQTTRFDVLKFDPNPAPKSEFTAEAIGISVGRSTNPWWTRLLILLSGVALLLVYRYLRKREEKAV